jgi:hypothetical protein
MITLGEDAVIQLRLDAEKWLSSARQVANETGNMEKTVKGVMERVDKQTGQASAKYALFGDESKLLTSQSRILESAMNRLTNLGFEAQSPEVQALKAKYDAIQTSMHGVAQNSAVMKDAFTTMAHAMQGPVAIAQQVIGAIGAVARVGADLYNDWSEAEKAGMVFSQAIKQSGTMAAGAEKRLSDYAATLQETTQFEGDATVAIMANLSAQGKSEKQIRDLIEAAANYAAATGTDLKSATEQLSGTLTGSAKSLARQSVEIKNLTKEELEAGKAIEIVNRQFAGQAELVGGSAFGTAERLKNTLGDLKEEYGRLVAEGTKPALEASIKAMRAKVDEMQATQNLKAALKGENAEYADAIAYLEKHMPQVSNYRGYVIDTTNAYKDQIAKLKELAAARIEMDREGSRAASASARGAYVAPTPEEIAKAARAGLDARSDAAYAAAQIGLDAALNEERINALVEQRLQDASKISAAYKQAAVEAMRLGGSSISGTVGKAKDWIDKASAIDSYAKELSAVIAMEELAAKAANYKYGASTEYRIELEKVIAMEELAAKAANYRIGVIIEGAKEATKAQETLANAYVSAYSSMASALGTALVSGEEGWKAFGKAGLNAIAGIIEAMAQQAVIAGGMALGAAFANPLDGGKWAAVAQYAAQVGAAYAVAGAVRAIPMAEGGSGTVSRPTLFLAGERGPEDFSFGPRSKGGLGGVTIIQNIGGSVIAERALHQMAVGAVARSQRGY